MTELISELIVQYYVHFEVFSRLAPTAHSRQRHQNSRHLIINGQFSASEQTHQNGKL